MTKQLFPGCRRATRAVCSALVALAALMLLGRVAAAAGEDGYQDVVAGAAQTSSAPVLVTIAYGLIWIVVLAYVVSIWRRQNRLSAQLQQLRRRLEGQRSA